MRRLLWGDDDERWLHGTRRSGRLTARPSGEARFPTREVASENPAYARPRNVAFLTDDPNTARLYARSDQRMPVVTAEQLLDNPDLLPGLKVEVRMVRGEPQFLVTRPSNGNTPTFRSRGSRAKVIRALEGWRINEPGIEEFYIRPSPRMGDTDTNLEIDMGGARWGDPMPGADAGLNQRVSQFFYEDRPRQLRARGIIDDPGRDDPRLAAMRAERPISPNATTTVARPNALRGIGAEFRYRRRKSDDVLAGVALTAILSRLLAGQEDREI